MDQEEVDYVIDAIEMIAEHGWKLLPLYATGWASGTYVHRSWNSNDELSWISVVRRCGSKGRKGWREGLRDGSSVHPLALCSARWHVLARMLTNSL